MSDIDELLYDMNAEERTRRRNEWRLLMKFFSAILVVSGLTALLVFFF